MLLSLVTFVGIEVTFNTIVVTLQYCFDSVYLLTRSTKVLSSFLLRGQVDTTIVIVVEALIRSVMFSRFLYPSSVIGSSSFFVRELVSSSYNVNLGLLQSYLTSIAVPYIIPNLIVVIAFQSFSLTFTLPFSFRSKTTSTFLRPSLDNVYFYSVQIITLITSGPTSYIIASLSTIVPSIAFLYTPLIEIVVDLNRYSNYSFQSRIVGSSTYKFILNIVFKTLIVYSY